MIEKTLLYILELTGLVGITAYKNVFLFWDPKITVNLTSSFQILLHYHLCYDTHSKNVVLRYDPHS